MTLDDQSGRLEIHFHSVPGGDRRHCGWIEGLSNRVHFTKRLFKRATPPNHSLVS